MAKCGLLGVECHVNQKECKTDFSLQLAEVSTSMTSACCNQSSQDFFQIAARLDQALTECLVRAHNSTKH